MVINILFFLGKEKVGQKGFEGDLES